MTYRSTCASICLLLALLPARPAHADYNGYFSEGELLLTTFGPLVTIGVVFAITGFGASSAAQQVHRLGEERKKRMLAFVGRNRACVIEAVTIGGGCLKDIALIAGHGAKHHAAYAEALRARRDALTPLARADDLQSDIKLAAILVDMKLTTKPPVPSFRKLPKRTPETEDTTKSAR